MSDNKKNYVELTEEDLDQVSGGYSYDHWKAMSDAERNAARAESDINHMLNKYCAMDDPNA